MLIGFAPRLPILKLGECSLIFVVAPRLSILIRLAMGGRSLIVVVALLMSIPTPLTLGECYVVPVHFDTPRDSGVFCNSCCYSPWSILTP